MSRHWPITRWWAVPLASLALGLAMSAMGVQAQAPGLAGSQIVNGGFESGPGVGWVQYSALEYAVIVDSDDLPAGIQPHNGSWEAWLAGDDDEVSYIQQQVTIAADTPMLGFWYWIDSIDPVCGSDWARVLVNGAQVDAFTLCTPKNTRGWRKYTVDLGFYGDQAVTLRIQADTGLMSFSSLHVDDVALEARQIHRLHLPSLLKQRTWPLATNAKRPGFASERLSHPKRDHR